MTLRCDAELLEMNTAKTEGMFWWRIWLIMMMMMIMIIIVKR